MAAAILIDVRDILDLPQTADLAKLRPAAITMAGSAVDNDSFEGKCENLVKNLFDGDEVTLLKKSTLNKAVDTALS